MRHAVWLCTMKPPVIYFEQSLMIESRQISWPAYLVGIAMIVIPLADVATSLYPWRFAEPRWRFGAVGLVSNSLLIPMAGLLVTYVTAVMLDHRTTRRIIGGVSFAVLALCIVALVLFALDALQTRAALPPEMRLSFGVATVAAAIKTIFAAGTFLAIGIAAFRGPRGRSNEFIARKVPLVLDPASFEPTKPGSSKP